MEAQRPAALSEPLLEGEGRPEGVSGGRPRACSAGSRGDPHHSPTSGWRAIEVHGPELFTGTLALGSPGGGKAGEHDALTQHAHAVAFACNSLLLFIKLWCFLSTGSIAVLAALIDSVVDHFAQLVLWGAARLKLRADPYYPAGRARLESVGVISCALLMAVASAAVVHEAGDDVYEYYATGVARHISLSPLDMLLLGLTVALKLVLWLWCTHVAQTTHNVTIISLAQDALNDVLSNAVSLVSAALTLIRPELWLSDPIGAILIGGYIILTWYSFSPTHPFLPYVAPHFSHISHFIHPQLSQAARDTPRRCPQQDARDEVQPATGRHVCLPLNRPTQEGRRGRRQGGEATGRLLRAQPSRSDRHHCRARLRIRAGKVSHHRSFSPAFSRTHLPYGTHPSVVHAYI